MNPMQNARIEKITLNIGAGKDQQKLEKGFALLQKISGMQPVRTITNARIAGWGLRPGLPIGCMVTLRKKKAADLLKRLLHAKDNTLKMSQFDSSGNVAFGIPEYIDIEGIEYDPKIGVIGLEVCVTLEKPGYRIKKRRLQKKRISKRHIVKKEEAIKFMQENFNVNVVGEES
jgi:large subunit ribosomal protein L5